MKLAKVTSLISEFVSVKKPPQLIFSSPIRSTLLFFYLLVAKFEISKRKEELNEQVILTFIYSHLSCHVFREKKINSSTKQKSSLEKAFTLFSLRYFYAKFAFVIFFLI
jgi:hypothetical protein